MRKVKFNGVLSVLVWGFMAVYGWFRGEGFMATLSFICSIWQAFDTVSELRSSNHS